MAFGVVFGQNNNVQTVNKVSPDSTGNIDLTAWNLAVNHPVGSWWFSDKPDSPETVLGGGVWKRMEGRFLLGADDSHPAETTGGNAEITQTVEQMPNHNHRTLLDWRAGKPTGDGYRINPDTGATWNPDGNATDILINYSAGGGQPMNIMNPYYATYIWRRVA